ncbi:MAG: FtsH protease activity modulator HflK [bacterium]
MEEDRPINLGNLKEIRPPDISSKPILAVLVVGLIVFLLSSFWFTIGPEEVGVILRLGKYNRTINPGLNYKLPFGIERVHKVPVERQLKLEFGFRTIKAGIQTEYSTRKYQEESLMLTGDLNAAEVEWIVQYRISDPYKYLFRVRNIETTFRDINEATVREVIGDRTVDEVLTVGRQEVADTVTQKLQELCNQYEMGIKIEQVVLQDVNPPETVKPAFNEVNEAQQEREKLINQAWSEYNKVVPRAKGEAERTIEEAKGYALERINKARGEAAKFNSVFKEYSKAKEVTHQRIYLETMGNVLKKVGRKLITDDKASGILPLFQLGKESMKNE